MKIAYIAGDPFEDCPGLRRAFTTPVNACGTLILPDYVIVDRSSPEWQWIEIKRAARLGLIEEDFVEIDEQETQLRYRLSKKGRREIERTKGEPA